MIHSNLNESTKLLPIFTWHASQKNHPTIFPFNKQKQTNKKKVEIMKNRLCFEMKPHKIIAVEMLTKHLLIFICLHLFALSSMIFSQQQALEREIDLFFFVRIFFFHFETKKQKIFYFTAQKKETFLQLIAH